MFVETNFVKFGVVLDSAVNKGPSLHVRLCINSS